MRYSFLFAIFTKSIDKFLKNHYNKWQICGELGYDFDIVVSRWKNKEIKSKEAMELLGLKPNTFYNLLKD